MLFVMIGYPFALPHILIPPSLQESIRGATYLGFCSVENLANQERPQARLDRNPRRVKGSTFPFLPSSRLNPSIQDPKNDPGVLISEFNFEGHERILVDEKHHVRFKCFEA